MAQALAGESSGAERVTHEGGDSGQVEVKRIQCVRTGGSHAGDRGPGGRVVVWGCSAVQGRGFTRERTRGKVRRLQITSINLGENTRDDSIMYHAE